MATIWISAIAGGPEFEHQHPLMQGRIRAEATIRAAGGVDEATGKARLTSDVGVRLSVLLLLKGTVWDSGCKSWYQTAEGINFAIWPKSTWRYWLATRKVNEADYRFVKCVGQSAEGTSGGKLGTGAQAMARAAVR